jgi:hypothetical protein
MGLFKKKEKKGEISSLPELPQLPELPESPETEEYSKEEIPQLPSFPNGSLGNRFSQNIIKEAVTGEKEGKEAEADEFAEKKRMQMMQKPLVREGIGKELHPRFETFERPEKVKEAEPVFIRIDKFEEGSQIFEEVKRKISEIENKLDDIKRVKEKEEKELEFWEEEIKQIKEQIEKIDKNIFSKIE